MKKRKSDEPGRKRIAAFQIKRTDGACAICGETFTKKTLSGYNPTDAATLCDACRDHMKWFRALPERLRKMMAFLDWKNLIGRPK